MSLSSFFVVTNALRLNFLKIHSSKHDRKISPAGDFTIHTTQDKEKEEMFGKNKITMKIEGMMCGHCEARVKQTLEGVKGVAKAEVSHVKGTAIVTLNGDVSAEALKEAVEAQGYKVVG